MVFRSLCKSSSSWDPWMRLSVEVCNLFTAVMNLPVNCLALSCKKLVDTKKSVATFTYSNSCKIIINNDRDDNIIWIIIKISLLFCSKPFPTTFFETCVEIKKIKNSFLGLKLTLFIFWRETIIAVIWQLFVDSLLRWTKGNGPK